MCAIIVTSMSMCIPIASILLLYLCMHRYNHVLLLLSFSGISTDTITRQFITHQLMRL